MKGYKHTVFGWIPEEWDVEHLGEICSHVKSGEAITSERIQTSGTYPVYGGNGLRGYTETYTHDGEFALIGRQGALCGNIQFVVGKNYVSEHAIAASASLQASTKWLAYYLEQRDLNKLSESSAQPGLAVGKLLKLKISLPPLAEQLKISTILSTWDRAIAKEELIIIALRARHRTLAKNLLSGTKRLKDFNQDWRTIKLSDIGTFSKGSGISKAELVSNGPPAIRYGEIYTVHHTVVRAFHSFINDVSAKASVPIQNGDILFAGSGETSAEIGKCVAFLNDTPAYAGGDIIIFRPKHASSLFLAYLLNSEVVVKQKTAMAKGHSVVHIYPKDLAELVLAIPSIEEQDAIGNVLQLADNEIDLAEQKLAAFREQKKGLMQTLLTGKTRVTFQ